MDKIFKDLRERDIDFLLIEEFNVNKQFLVYLLSNSLVDKINSVQNEKAIHSITDDGYGETDIYLTFFSDKKEYILLIENKIDAPFQPDQVNRYNLRKENIKQNRPEATVHSVIIAPEKYLNAHKISNDFDIKITYEVIMKYFISENSDRSKYKANLFNNAIKQEKQRYIIKENPIVTKFWKDYWFYLKENHPEIIMKEPDIKPSDADWLLFYLKWLPKGWEIFHKLSKGCIDIQTKLTKEEIMLFNIENTDIRIVKTGKSFSFRIDTPIIDKFKSFDLQIAEIVDSINKFKSFYELEKEIVKRCKISRN